MAEGVGCSFAPVVDFAPDAGCARGDVVFDDDMITVCHEPFITVLSGCTSGITSEHDRLRVLIAIDC